MNITDYAAEFVRLHPEQMGSPFSSWMLSHIEDPAVFEAMKKLPPNVQTALAAWTKPIDSLKAWRESLSSRVETGNMPTQAEANKWVTQATKGMITSTPLSIRPDTAVALLTTIALKDEWDTPLSVSPADPNTFGLERMAVINKLTKLRTPYGPILLSEVRGQHVRVSFALGASQMSPLDVGLAHLTGGQPEDMSVDDLDFLIREHRGTKDFALVPCWKAKSTFSILSDPGMSALGHKLIQFLPPEWLPADVEAKQTAVAEFNQYGISAAAVSMMAICCGCAMRPSVMRHHTTFDRPFSVVIWADEIPLFTGWVTEPMEPPLSRD